MHISPSQDTVLRNLLNEATQKYSKLDYAARQMKEALSVICRGHTDLCRCNPCLALKAASPLLP